MIGGIIIGDEIMRGKREDKHFRKLIELLAARGLKLDWAQYLGDSPALITETLRRSLATPDIVFCFGGIGATPDDHTRQCAAAAVGVDLALHAEAEAEIRARFGDEATPQRLKMGEFPIGSHIIPNPYNRIPGFSVGDHHFVPGFPVMAWPMIESVLDAHYSQYFLQNAYVEKSVIILGAMEATLTPLMESIESAHPGVKVFSLPSVDHPQWGRHIELGVKGAPDAAEMAYRDLRQGLTAFALQYGPELVR